MFHKQDYGLHVTGHSQDSTENVVVVIDVVVAVVTVYIMINLPRNGDSCE